ncbi:hypothetical protein CFP65_5984 [Kitasatospora sp. MMS16-BH015]|uniref:hypothetical protein n=1 Tax=Kitasatospora sp. MMS16-BH015 TaxID=2018025 RepID=UPI000CA31C1A|nr:hypothetical protein [Kitasatospora sp. MMS16-BH015]AUG80658.1 hypothetical protein CFP65_5984 [Kitasatospora sp. MMS16-BH015]
MSNAAIRRLAHPVLLAGAAALAALIPTSASAVDHPATPEAVATAQRAPSPGVVYLTPVAPQPVAYGPAVVYPYPYPLLWHPALGLLL